jgi:exopolysaccharide biosynthesis polyprenyl glycosylphosphotransferase
MFRRVSIRLALLLGDGVIVLASLYLATWLRPQLSFGQPLTLANTALDWPVYALTLFIWGLGFILLDVYNLQKNLRLFDELQRVTIAHIAATLTLAGALYFSFREVSRLQIMLFAAISLLLLIAYRLLFRLLLHLFGDKRYGTRRILIVGARSAGHNVAQMVEAHHWTGLRMVGFVDDDPQANTLTYPHFGPIKETVEIVQQQRINEIIFTLPRQAHVQMANLVTKLEKLKVNIRAVPDFLDLVFLRSAVEDFGDMAMVTLREPALDPFQRLVKRAFDLVVALILLILALPVMLIVAIIIKLDSPGPVIFTQQRMGENQQPFAMVKFRTMVHDAESQQTLVNKTDGDGMIIHKFYDDPRVTRAGKFLRHYSLDELPQLVNIIKGDMSLVGPRPELPWLVNKYEPWQRKRFEVPQGLTGWWQVNGRADKPMHLHTEDDLYYIKNYSLWLDLQILWRTIIAVIDRRGAY